MSTTQQPWPSQPPWRKPLAIAWPTKKANQSISEYKSDSGKRVWESKDSARVKIYKYINIFIYLYLYNKPKYSASVYLDNQCSL